MKHFDVCYKGYSRVVFLVGKYAIKVPTYQGRWRTFIRGLSGNLDEAAIYRYVRQHRPEYTSLLCPVLHCWFGGLILIMPRAETDLCEQDMHEQRVYERIQATRLYGDDKCENFGKLGGQIVKIDYGHCPAIFD